MNRDPARHLAALVAVVALAAACSEAGPRAKPKRPPAPVGVAAAVRKNVPVDLRAIGNVQPFTTVAVRAQVGGQLLKVHFREGENVPRGRLLFTIDPRPFEATLRQAEANLARDGAQLQQALAALSQRRAEVLQAEANLARDRAQRENARNQLARYQQLFEKRYVSPDEIDRVRTNVASLEATVRADRAAVETARAALEAGRAGVESAKAAVQADRAAVENARLQLAYTAIRAPVGGRTGNLNVHAGNVVKANDETPLVTILQIRPVYVAFSVAEQFLPGVRRARNAGVVPVDAFPPGRSAPAGRGELTFVNNAVDPATGTILLKATFRNDDGALWPGQFVSVRCVLGQEEGRVVVPSQALQPGQQGSYVFVVKADSTVEARPVVVGRALDGETVIERGLQGGERVVVDGQLRLSPGAAVEVRVEPVASGDKAP